MIVALFFAANNNSKFTLETPIRYFVYLLKEVLLTYKTKNVVIKIVFVNSTGFMLFTKTTILLIFAMVRIR